MENKGANYGRFEIGCTMSTLRHLTRIHERDFFFQFYHLLLKKKARFCRPFGDCARYTGTSPILHNRARLPNRTARQWAVRDVHEHMYGVEEKKLPHHVYFNIAIVAERTRWGVSATIGCREDECTTPAMIAYHSVGMLALYTQGRREGVGG